MNLAKVSGRGEFPMDMLRYDSCSPATEIDGCLISQTFKKYGTWDIYVKSSNKKQKWTVDRWTSFGVRFEPIDAAYPPADRMIEIDERPAKLRREVWTKDGRIGFYEE